MEQEPGSETSASKIEGSSEGGSTSFRDRGEGDSNPEIISQDPGTTSGQVECARVTDNPNRVDDVAELQTRGAHEDVDHTSEQGGGSVISTEENVSSEDLSLNTKNSMEGTVTSSSDKEGIPAVSTGNDENQQTSDGWTLVESEKSEADTGGKGEVSRKMEKITGLIGEVQQNITEAHNSLHSDDTTRAKSLKNDPVVAKVAKTEREFAADNEREDNKAIEADDQATAEGSCEASVASGQGLKSSPADVTLATSKPDLVVSNAQGVERLSNSMSMKVTGRSNPLGILRPSKSWRDTLSYSKSPRGINVYSNSPKETSIGEEAPSTVLNSGTQKEVDLSLEDPRTVLNSGTQKEVDLSLEDPRAVLNSGTQKEVDLSLEDPRAVSRSDSLKEVSTSPEAEGEVSASEAQEVSRIVLEAPSPVPTSGALISQEDLSVVSNSVVQKDVDSISEALSTLSTSDAQEEVSANVEASGMVSNSDVGSSDSPNTVLTPEAQEKIEKSSNMKPNSEVQNEVSMTVDAPTKVCEAEGEISEVSEAPSTASTSEAQNGIRTSLEENIPRAEGSAPEGLQGKVSEVDEGKLRNSPQKSETTVCDVRGGLPEARCEEGKKTSVPEGDARDTICSPTPALNVQAMLEQKDITIRGIVKEYVNKGNLLTKSEERFKGLQHDYDELQQKYDGLLNHRERLDRKNAELQRNCQDWSRLFREKETEYARHLGTMKLSYAKSYEELKQRGQRENYEKEILIRDLRGQLEQMKKECGMLQDQMSLYEQQHANEQSRGGSYLDDTKAATPALLVSALNGVKDASNNFVKVLRNSIQPGMDAAQFEDHIGAVSRNGHTKFQYQAYVCRILFEDFEHPYSGASNVVLPPTTYFRQYQNHDLKKTDTVDRLFTSDRDIDASLHEFCFNKFSNLMKDIQDQLTDRSIDLRKEVQNKKHPRGSKLYVSFCKLAVSVWLLQRLAFSFLHPAEQFTADRGAPFDPNRMQSVVPLDEPSSDEEVHLRVGFYVLPGFVVGNSAIPCEVYVALK